VKVLISVTMPYGMDDPEHDDRDDCEGQQRRHIEAKAPFRARGPQAWVWSKCCTKESDPGYKIAW
jgi:hypothetical protein